MTGVVVSTSDVPRISSQVCLDQLVGCAVLMAYRRRRSSGSAVLKATDYEVRADAQGGKSSAGRKNLEEKKRIVVVFRQEVKDALVAVVGSMSFRDKRLLKKLRFEADNLIELDAELAEKLGPYDIRRLIKVETMLRGTLEGLGGLAEVLG